MQNLVSEMSSRKSSGANPSALSAPPLEDLILLHLLNYREVEPHTTASREQSQKGISAEMDRALSQISRLLNDLTKMELIISQSRHVVGESRRCKVYWLSDTGQFQAEQVRKNLLEREVAVQTLEGDTIDARLGDVNSLLGLNLPLSTLLSMATSGKIQPQRNGIEESRFLPNLEGQFVGRESEQEDIHLWLNNSEGAMVILGMAGIGKTTLTRVVFEGLRGRRPLIWFSITPYDTSENFLGLVANLLDRQSPSQLGIKLGELAHSNLGQMQGHLLDFFVEEMISTPPPLIVLDDFHDGNSHFVEFVTNLMLRCKGDESARWLITSRHADGFSSVRGKLALHTLVLEGIKEENALEMDGIDHSNVGQLMNSTGGHPLALKLRGGGPGGDDETALREFIEHQIVSDLSLEQKNLTDLASLQLFPSPGEELLEDLKLPRSILQSLVEQGIISRDLEGTVKLHELLRQPLRDNMPQAVARQLHKRQYRRFRRGESDGQRLRAIHHSVGWGDLGRALRHVEEWSNGLIERGRSELYYVLDPVVITSNPRRAAAHLARARILFMWGRGAEATEELGQIDPVALKRMPREQAFQVLLLQTRVAQDSRDDEQLRDLKRQLVEMTPVGAESWAVGDAHNELGLAAQMQDENELARHHYLEAIRIFEEREERNEAPPRSAGSIKPLANLAMLQEHHGSTKAAINNLKRAIERSWIRNDEVSRARCTFFVAQLFLRHQDLSPGDFQLPDPVESLNEAAAIFRQRKDRSSLVRVLVVLGEHYLDNQNWEIGQKVADEARLVAERIGNPAFITEVESLQSRLN